MTSSGQEVGTPEVGPVNVVWARIHQRTNPAGHLRSRRPVWLAQQTARLPASVYGRVMAHYDVTGGGQPIVFLHAGCADRRMWHPQWDHFASTNRLVRIDAHGFGSHTPGQDHFSRSSHVVAVLDELGIGSAVLVGASMGARTAIQMAVEVPERVDGLMLLAAPIGLSEWSAPVQDMWASEAKALDQGDIKTAVELVLEFWVDGPDRDRARLSDQDRALVADMQTIAFEHELSHPSAGAEDRFRELEGRVREIAAPTQVVYGDQDAVDFAKIARSLAAAIPNASLHQIADAAHLPSLESPAECNALLAELLAQVG